MLRTCSLNMEVRGNKGFKLSHLHFKFMGLVTYIPSCFSLIFGFYVLNLIMNEETNLLN
jgi:hypothetical protein